MALGVAASKIVVGLLPLSELDIAYPWAFFNCHDGQIESTAYTHLLDRSSGTYALAAADLQMAGTLGTAWSAVPGWFKGSGVSAHHFAQAAPSAYSALFPAAGNLLVWASINYNTAGGSVASPMFLSFGDAGTAGGLFRVGLDRANRKLRVQYRNTSSSGTQTYTYSDASITSSTQAEIAFLFSWTPSTFSTQGWINGVEAGSSNLGVADRPNPFAMTAFTNRIAVGGSYSAGSAAGVGWEGSVRNIGIIQYGDSVPANLTTIIGRLYQSKGFLNWSLA